MSARILILTSDTGGGHRSVANAIAGTIKYVFRDRYEVQVADVMADGFFFPLSRATLMYGPFANRLPRAWGLFWHSTNGRHRAPLSLRVVLPLAATRLKRLLLRSAPDLIVSTHPWANHIPAWLSQKMSWKVPLVTVITDLVTIHHWWLCRDADLCLVATPQVNRKALEAGLAPEAVEVVGLPVGLDFLTASASRDELRRGLGLAPELFTILVAGGREGMGRVFDTARAIAQAFPKVQLLVVAGRNRRLRKRLEQVAWEVPTRIIGFARNMPDLMHTADVMISKAGPSTISEALACGLPMLISGSLRGQEEGNAGWVVKNGAGLFTPTTEQIVAAVAQLQGPGNRALAEMGRRARQAAQPDAAAKVARRLDDLARCHRHVA